MGVSANLHMLRKHLGIGGKVQLAASKFVGKPRLVKVGNN
jgi:hypothetical protein